MASDRTSKGCAVFGLGSMLVAVWMIVHSERDKSYRLYDSYPRITSDLPRLSGKLFALRDTGFNYAVDPQVMELIPADRRAQREADARTVVLRTNVDKTVGKYIVKEGPNAGKETMQALVTCYTVRYIDTGSKTVTNSAQFCGGPPPEVCKGDCSGTDPLPDVLRFIRAHLNTEQAKPKFVPLDISAFTNKELTVGKGLQPPEGQLSLRGVPFLLATKRDGRLGSISLSSLEGLVSSVHLQGVRVVYTLINSLHAGCGIYVGQLQFLFVRDLSYTYDLETGRNVRDFEQGPYCNDARELRDNGSWSSGSMRIDVQRIQLPDSSFDDTLEFIHYRPSDSTERTLMVFAITVTQPPGGESER
jgi:hypothetical protein